ncbi:MAG: catechol 2,3-dioxygenase-like lactoylglutathione lyase family enzyme [Pseudohongiellaceae bacterium]
MHEKEIAMQIIEHVHLGVKNLAKTEAFLIAALAEYSRRGSGYAQGYGNWVHVGGADNYIALTESEVDPDPNFLRHIGLAVDDLDTVIRRLEAAGYSPSDASALDSHPFRRRVYYLDDNGIHWEFVQYLSDDSGQRNDYTE